MRAPWEETKTLLRILPLFVCLAAASSAATINLNPPASNCAGNSCSAILGTTNLTAGNTYVINWDFADDPFVTVPYPVVKITFSLDVTGNNSGPLKLVLYTQGGTTVDAVVAVGSPFQHSASTSFDAGDFDFAALKAAIAPTGLFTTSLDWVVPLTGGKLNSASVTVDYVKTPEPAAAAITGLGLLLLAGLRRAKAARASITG